MEHGTYHPVAAKKTAAGVDVGATLAKLALRGADGSIARHLIPTPELARVAARLRDSGIVRVGLTGGGAARLGRLVAEADAEVVPVNEFAAWGTGAAAMLREEPGLAPAHRYLLVSVGTGTSVLLADGLSVNRVGGTALGGGTVVGLGAGLVGTGDFAGLAALAQAGSRSTVDLLVSDIYRAGEIALPGDITASSFGKLAARQERGDAVADADLANAVMGLVGENVALLCGGLAAAAQVSRVVFGGSTLRENPVLVQVLGDITQAIGREAVFLPHGEFSGALGALLLASASDDGTDGTGH